MIFKKILIGSILFGMSFSFVFSNTGIIIEGGINGSASGSIPNEILKNEKKENYFIEKEQNLEGLVNTDKVQKINVIEKELSIQSSQEKIQQKALKNNNMKYLLIILFTISFLNSIGIIHIILKKK